MGKRVRRLLELSRAGALAAGTAFLLGVWFQGMARLGFRDNYPNGWGDVLFVMAIGVALGATLGFPAPAARPLHLLDRVVVTALLGVAIVAALGGLTWPLVKFADIAERNLTVYFIGVGGILVGLGLRRRPRTLAARVALGSPAAFLLVTRLLAAHPPAAHAVTQKLFPLRPETVRSELERIGWGPLAIDRRTRIVTFATTPSYRTDYNKLTSESKIKFTLEVVTPFFQDACGYYHSRQPEVPPFVRAFPTRAACEEKHPGRSDRRYEMYHYTPSPCCVFEVKERHPGEQIGASREVPFTFRNFTWTADR